MSRSSFSKAYEEITNLEPMEMTFTINDADLDKLNEILKDINVKECPLFEVQDKHGVKAKYYREPRWIPCSERLPEEDDVEVLCTVKQQRKTDHSETIIVEQGCYFYGTWLLSYDNQRVNCIREVLAWMPLPSPYQEEGEEETE